MALKTDEKNVAFCEELFQEACNEAKKRIGSHPKFEQLQMSDLLRAFHGLKLGKYSTQYGHVSTEWNKALAIIEGYIAANKKKAPPHLPSEIGQAIGCALIAWTQFDKLPPETKESIKKAHTNSLLTKEKILQHISHFFNEVKVRTSVVAASEREVVMALLAIYEPQCKEAGKKGSVSEVHACLDKILQEMNRLLQKKKPSRELQSFIIKAQHDLERFKTANF